MFGNTNYNNSNASKNNNSTSTQIRTFFGDLSCFQISYWDDKISLKINPLASVSSEGIRQYDYNRKIQTALTTDKCIALSKTIEKTVLPAIESKTDVSIGTILSKTAIAINGKKEDKDYNIYFTIYPLIEDSNKNLKIDKPNAYIYKFNKTNILLDFNNDSGEGKEEQVHSEFLYLYSKLKHIANISGDVPHAINVNNNNKAKINTQSTQSNGTQQNYSAPVSSFNMDNFPF